MSVYGANTAATLSSYESQYASSIRDVSSYWSKLAASSLDWYAPFVSAGGGGGGGGALSGSLTDGSVSWFGGGKLNTIRAYKTYIIPSLSFVAQWANPPDR